MRIVYLNPCGQMGGAETSLVELLASVRAAEPDWHLTLVLGADGPLASKAAAVGVAVHVVPMPSGLARLGDSGSNGHAAGRAALLPGLLSAAGYLRRLARVVRTERPDLIHSTGFKMHLLSVWARPQGIPVLWHLHDYVRSRPVMSRFLRWHSGKCAVAIANSQSVAADVHSVCGGRLKVETIYNAIDLSRFSPEGPKLDLDALCGLPPVEPGTVRVGLVATFAHWKGHRTFLKALSMLPPEAPVRSYVIGGPIYQTVGSQHSIEELRAEAGQLGLKDRLGFSGFVDDTASAMRALDIVVHASTSPEPFGMVIVEGMACGRAVVASQAGGAAEIFEDGVDALGHPPGDAAVLARLIGRVVSDEPGRVRLGRAGRTTAERLSRGDRLAEQLVALYRTISARSAARGEGPAFAGAQGLGGVDARF